MIGASPSAPGFRMPSRPVLIGVAGGAGVLLWALTGWHWIALVVALGVALVLRLVGFLLPRRLRRYGGVLAVGAGAVALVAWSSPWAVVLCLGLAVMALAFLTQHGQIRAAGLVAGGVLAVGGSAGLLVEHALEVSRAEAAERAASDYARAQMLPDDPAGAVVELMRALPQGDRDAGLCALMFTETGQHAFADAYHRPDCPGALQAARARILDPARYQRIDVASLVITMRPGSELVDVDGCTVRWRADDRLGELLTGSTRPQPPPGPPFGQITLVSVSNGAGWVVADFRRCTERP